MIVRRVSISQEAEALLNSLKAQYKDLIFHQSEGCCDGSAPMCLPKADFFIDETDYYLGSIAGCDFFIAADQFEYWQYSHLYIDLVEGRGSSFSIEIPIGYRFITKAVQALHLTQPAVSIQLKKLQDQFDIPLTEVVGRKIYITDFGYEIAASADRIMNEVLDIKHRAAAHQGRLSGRLKLAIVSTAKYVMPFFLSDFLSRNEDVELEMDVTNKAKVLESLAANEVDFALVSVLPEQLQCEKETLMENRLYLVGPAAAVVSENDDVHLLEGLPLIFREPGSATRRAMEEFINSQELQVNVKMELTSNEAVKQAVIAGLGFSIMPLIGIRNELSSGRLKIIEMPGLPLVTSWNLIWLKGKQPAVVAEAFLKHLRENKASIIEEAFSGF
ncbi:MAG: DUF779 domain-containing protein [Flavobacteriales bacterium]|nr:DUF779 domain-containing protein [Flavobacteriales bacterium]